MANAQASPSGAVRPPIGTAGTLRPFRLFGFDIRIHWSWLIIFALLSWSLASEYLPEVYPGWTAPQRWLIAAITSLLFFASVLAHELAHSLVARRHGIPVQGITLFVFGGVSAIGGEPRTARDEFWMAIVGPLTSFAAAVVCFAVWLAAQGTELRAVQEIAGYLAYINVAVGVFNLVPGYPLDGGRVLRAIVWGIKRNVLEATRIAANAGRAVAVLLIGAGILVIVSGGVVGGFWFILIGWFLWNAAESSYQQLLVQTDLGWLTVGALTDAECPRVPPDLSLRRFAHEHVLRENRRAFLVAPEDDAILGLITTSDLRKVPEEEWDRVSVFRAMTPRERLVAVTPQTEVLVALHLMAEHNVDQLPVMTNQGTLGLITRSALVRALQLRREIEPPRRSA